MIGEGSGETEPSGRENELIHSKSEEASTGANAKRISVETVEDKI